MSDYVTKDDLEKSLQKSFGSSSISLFKTKIHNDSLLRDSTSGWTPLHFYAKYNDEKSAEEFLSFAWHTRDDVDCEDSTALHLAATYNSVQCTQVLLKYDADILIQGMFGKTARDIAHEKGHTEVVWLLDNHGACSNTSLSTGQTTCQICDKVIVETCTCNFEHTIHHFQMVTDCQQQRISSLEEREHNHKKDMQKQQQEIDDLQEKVDQLQRDYKHLYFESKITNTSGNSFASFVGIGKTLVGTFKFYFSNVLNILQVLVH